MSLTYIFTLAQILQSVFIVAIFVEIFKLFSSFNNNDIIVNDFEKAKSQKMLDVNDKTIVQNNNKERKIIEDIDKEINTGRELIDSTDFLMQKSDEILKVIMNDAKLIKQPFEFETKDKFSEDYEFLSKLNDVVSSRLIVNTNKFKELFVNSRKKNKTEINIFNNLNNELDDLLKKNEQIDENIQEELTKVVRQQDKVKISERIDDNKRWNNLVNLYNKFSTIKNKNIEYSRKIYEDITNIKNNLKLIDKKISIIECIERELNNNIDYLFKNDVISIKNLLKKMIEQGYPYPRKNDDIISIEVNCTRIIKMISSKDYDDSIVNLLSDLKSAEELFSNEYNNVVKRFNVLNTLFKERDEELLKIRKNFENSTF